MCGIAFSYVRGGSVEAIQRRIGSALGLLAHRGPDDEGMCGHGSWAIGHRRLSIVDLAASQQPMKDSTGRYVLAFNGEIYNYRELRRNLADDWTFTTSGDTEVLLAGLLIQGPQFLGTLEGMWALALWDTREEELFLARDRFGKKPLYYLASKDSIHCASELPSLRALAPTDFSEDEHSTADYFRYGFYLPGTTAYRDVQELNPGTFATWRPSRGLLSEPFWRPPITPFHGRHEEALEQVRHGLEAAVKRRLVADVEVGAFLSGGIDSSLIVALATRFCDRRLKTFSIGFSDPTYDETSYARKVASMYGTDHHELRLEEANEQDLEHLILRHFGQPFADPSVLPTFLVSKLAAEHVKVVLSGDGSDELFSGYQRYQAELIQRWYDRIPRVLTAPIEAVVTYIPEPTAHHSRSLLKKAHLFIRASRRERLLPEYISGTAYTPDELAALVPDIAGMGHCPPRIQSESKLDSIMSMMAQDLLVYLPQDILAKVDRASMAASIEARAPFLDSGLAALTLGLPRRWHRRGITGKRILREAFAELLPTDIWQRRKQGFSVPVGAWFAGSLGTRLREMTEDQPSVLSQSRVHEMLEQHQSRKVDLGLQLWTMYVYLLWRRQTFKAAAA